MRILCLHGNGTNSEILRLQTAPLIHELEDGHIFDFVEAAMQVPMSDGVSNLVASTEQRFYAFYNPDDIPATIPAALRQLDEYVGVEGPFDGVLGFSAGAVLAALYLIDRRRQGEQVLFQFAVFLSSASSMAELSHLGVHPETGLIRIPTAHIWGVEDHTAPSGGSDIAKLCDASNCVVVNHAGGHELPRDASLTEAVHGIRRTILLSQNAAGR